jgi:hypothetical protein
LGICGVSTVSRINYGFTAERANNEHPAGCAQKAMQPCATCAPAGKTAHFCYFSHSLPDRLCGARLEGTAFLSVNDKNLLTNKKMCAIVSSQEMSRGTMNKKDWFGYDVEQGQVGCSLTG